MTKGARGGNQPSRACVRLDPPHGKDYELHKPDMSANCVSCSSQSYELLMSAIARHASRVPRLRSNGANCIA